MALAFLAPGYVESSHVIRKPLQFLSRDRGNPPRGPLGGAPLDPDVDFRDTLITVCMALRFSHHTFPLIDGSKVGEAP